MKKKTLGAEVCFEKEELVDFLIRLITALNVEILVVLFDLILYVPSTFCQL